MRLRPVLLPNQAFALCQQENQQADQSSQRNTGGSHRNIHKGFQIGIVCAGCGNSTGVQFGAVGEGNDQLAVFIDGNAGNTNAVLALYLAEIFLGAVGEGDDQLAVFVQLNVGNPHAVRAVFAVCTVLAVGSVFSVDTVLTVFAVCAIGTCGLNAGIGGSDPPVAVAADIRGQAILAVLAVFPVLPVCCGILKL